jgi:hypothetical protein
MAREAAMHMDFDFDDTLARGLSCYVRLVTAALGLSGDCSYVHGGRPASAYLALDGSLPDFPGRDVALLWDEQRGWSIATETHSGEDPVVRASFGTDVLPLPRDVAQWAKLLLHDGLASDGELPAESSAITPDGVARRLAAYAFPGFAA